MTPTAQPAALQPAAETDSSRDPDRDREVAVLAEILDRQAAWSAKTFGPGPRLEGVMAHLRKELGEVEAAPTDVYEWVDVALLALDGAWRAGHTPAEVAAAFLEKSALVRARVWPDWRDTTPDAPIEHIRTADPDVPAGLIREGHRS